MSNPFIFIEAAGWNKQNPIRSGDSEESEYKPFITNRAFSYHIDSIFEANLMNSMSHLDNLCQFEFLLNSLSKRKRFSKWHKPEENAEVDAVMEYFGYSRSKAEQVMKLLSPDDISMIYAKLNKGGTDERRNHKKSSRGKAKKT